MCVLCKVCVTVCVYFAVLNMNGFMSHLAGFISKRKEYLNSTLQFPGKWAYLSFSFWPNRHNQSHYLLLPHHRDVWSLRAVKGINVILVYNNRPEFWEKAKVLMLKFGY